MRNNFVHTYVCIYNYSIQMVPFSIDLFVKIILMIFIQKTQRQRNVLNDLIGTTIKGALITLFSLMEANPYQSDVVEFVQC